MPNHVVDDERNIPQPQSLHENHLVTENLQDDELSDSNVFVCPSSLKSSIDAVTACLLWVVERYPEKDFQTCTNSSVLTQNTSNDTEQKNAIFDVEFGNQLAQKTQCVDSIQEIEVESTQASNQVITPAHNHEAENNQVITPAYSLEVNGNQASNTTALTQNYNDIALAQSRGDSALEFVVNLVKECLEKHQPFARTLLACKGILRRFGVKISKISPSSLQKEYGYGASQFGWAYAFSAATSQDRYWLCGNNTEAHLTCTYGKRKALWPAEKTQNFRRSAVAHHFVPSNDVMSANVGAGADMVVDSSATDVAPLNSSALPKTFQGTALHIINSNMQNQGVLEGNNHFGFTGLVDVLTSKQKVASVIEGNLHTQKTKEVAFDPNLPHHNIALVGEQAENEHSSSALAHATLGMANLIGMPMYDVTGASFVSSHQSMKSLAEEHAEDEQKTPLVAPSKQQSSASHCFATSSESQLLSKKESCMSQNNNQQSLSATSGALSKLQALNYYMQQHDFQLDSVCEDNVLEQKSDLLSNATHQERTNIVKQQDQLQTVNKRKALFAQDFGIDDDASQRRDFAAAFKVGELDQVFLKLKERSGHQDWLDNTAQAPVVTRLALHICGRWMQRRCHQAQIVAPNNIQDSEMEIYYDTVILLIQTMTFAMRVDEKINPQERQALYEFCLNLFGSQITSIRGEVDRCLTMPMDISNLVQKIHYAEEKLDMFVLSAVILEGSGFISDGYLENLAACLEIDPSLQRLLRQRAKYLVDLGKEGFNFDDLDRLYLENRAAVSAIFRSDEG